MLCWQSRLRSKLNHVEYIIADENDWSERKKIVAKTSTNTNKLTLDWESGWGMANLWTSGRKSIERARAHTNQIQMTAAITKIWLFSVWKFVWAWFCINLISCFATLLTHTHTCSQPSATAALVSETHTHSKHQHQQYCRSQWVNTHVT